MQRTNLICHNFFGINRTSACFSSPVVTASDVQNVELFATGTNSGVGIRTAKGNRIVCDSIPDDEVVINIYESVQKSQTYFFVYTESIASENSEGKIYLFNLETGELELKAKGLSVTGKSCATDVSQGWSDLWVFSNGEDILTIEIGKKGGDNKSDEVDFLELTDSEGRRVKGLGVVVFAGRLWIFSDQVLWYSVQENIYDFSTSDAELVTSAGYIEFVKNITAIYPYLGALAVFHKDSSCMITQEDKGFSKSFDSPGGCAGYDALVFHGTQLYFYDDTKKGVFSFLQVVNGDKTLGENIAIDIQEELFSVQPAQACNIRALSVVNSDRNEVWLYLPGTDSRYSTIMIYDYLRRSWVKRKCPKINCFTVYEGKIYSAGAKIYEEYSGQDFSGEFIEAYYKATPLNFGIDNSIKILAYPPKITMNMDYSNDFYIEYTKDYNALTRKVRHIVSKTLSNVLHFDRDCWDKTTFPHQKINVIKKLPTAYFKTLQMGFFTREANQSFCINNIEFGKIKSKL